MTELHIEVWERCLKVIKDNINYQSFKTWFSPIKSVRLDNNVLTIQVPSQFFYEWLEEHYIHLLKKTIKSELGNTGRLEYSIVMDTSASQSDPYTIKVPTSHNKSLNNPAIAMPIDLNKGNNKEIPNPFVIPGLKKIKIHSQLIDAYSFDNYIEGDCNRLARSAGFAVATNPGKTAFNPLLIYSPVGLGKTHLSHAIGIQVKNNFPDKTVLYVAAEQFINQFIDSVRNNTHNDFVHFYQMIFNFLLEKKRLRIHSSIFSIICIRKANR
jgi:chromosomal replication initiator protein